MSTRSIISEHVTTGMVNNGSQMQLSVTGAGEEQVYTKVAFYKGLVVAVKKVNRKHPLSLTREDLVELKIVSFG